jgi:hypothetical protein
MSNNIPTSPITENNLSIIINLPIIENIPMVENVPLIDNVPTIIGTPIGEDVQIIKKLSNCNSQKNQIKKKIDFRLDTL